MSKTRPANWGDLAHVIGGTVAILAAAFAYLLISDPYGRLGIRPSAKIPNLAERELAVSRALDRQFDSAIVGNSTTIPMQPEVLDRLTGRRFVSLSMSGSGPRVALAAARLFLRHHPNAKTVIIGLDDGWCTNGADFDEGHPFPSWLYGSDLKYLAWLAMHTSWETLKVARAQAGSNRLDGYHPYDDAFRGHGFNDPEVVLKRLNRATRPVQARYSAPYRFEPPEMIRDLIAETPDISFILFWTPRYLTLLPIEGTSAAEADGACKRQVEELTGPNVRIVDWSGPRPENLDPANFYEPNHYRDTLALKIEVEIASALSWYSSGASTTNAH
jgi:hypothetical protein